jgi:hypothetical protein
MLLNLVSVWMRGRTTGRMTGVYLVAAGAWTIVLSKIGFGFEQAGGFGVALTLVGSLMSALNQPVLMASSERRQISGWRRLSLPRIRFFLRVLAGRIRNRSR